MKLELRHLAPYLPYKVKVSDIHYLTIGTGEGNGIGSINHVLKAVNEGKIQYRPILRPLSDLTKVIEHNGEKFVPYDKIKELYSNTPQFTEYKENWIDMYGIMNSKCEYVCVQKLFEWHFDVFGLIEAGLAIDINTLK